MHPFSLSPRKTIFLRQTYAIFLPCSTDTNLQHGGSKVMYNLENKLKNKSCPRILSDNTGVLGMMEQNHGETKRVARKRLFVSQHASVGDDSCTFAPPLLLHTVSVTHHSLLLLPSRKTTRLRATSAERCPLRSARPRHQRHTARTELQQNAPPEIRTPITRTYEKCKSVSLKDATTAEVTTVP